MKYLLIFTFLFSLPLFCSAQNLREPAMVKTIGESIVYAAPNEVLLFFTVETLDTVVTKAKKENTKISKSAIAFLRQQGISEKHIQTQYMTVYPRKNRNHPKIKTVHYSVSQRIEICIQNISSFENIVDGLLERGIYTISGPRFRNTEIKDFKNQARKKAMQVAKEKATLLANELGQDIGRAYQIKEIPASSFSSSQAGYGTSEVDLSGVDENSSFAPGQLEVRAKIEVSFYLKN